MSYSKIIDSLNEGASANVKLVESLLKGIYGLVRQMIYLLSV